MEGACGKWDRKDRGLAEAEGSAHWASGGPGMAAGTTAVGLGLSSSNQDHISYVCEPVIAVAGHLGRWCPRVCAEGGEGEPWLEAVGWGWQAIPGKSQSLSSFLPLCSYKLPIHLARGFDK